MGIRFCCQVDDAIGLVKALGGVDRQGCATRGVVAGQDQGSLRVADVPPCSLGILRRRRFLQRVRHRDHAIFGPTPPRAPASNLQTHGHGDVEGCPINACLTA